MKNKKITCNRCSHKSLFSELILKMGGLLCPECQVILVNPGTTEYSEELNKRRRESKIKDLVHKSWRPN